MATLNKPARHLGAALLVSAVCATSAVQAAYKKWNPEPDKPHTRQNDGKVDARGRFVAGRMDTQQAGPNGALYRLDPDVIDMPVKKVTSDSFGGPEPDVLLLTSMAKPPLPRFPGDRVLRGSLFAIRGPGVRRPPEPRFGG